MRVKFEGDFDFENLPDNLDRQVCVEGGIVDMVLNNPEDFLDIIFQHNIIVTDEKKEVPKAPPIENHFGFYTGR